MEIKFIKYLKNRFKEGYIIRLTDEVAFFYKIRTTKITLTNVSFSFNEGGNLHKDFFKTLRLLKLSYINNQIRTDDTTQKMIKSLETDFFLSQPLIKEREELLLTLIK